MKSLFKFAAVLAFVTVAAVPARADENRDLLQARMKTALNEMVQDVRAAATPAEKRETMEQFFGKVEQRARLANNLPFLGAENREALTFVQGKFAGYHADLKTQADRDLDGFANFVQQDLEQAESSWSSGGIYLSTGAIIIILIILILIT
jgi:hypothetical protein